MEDKHGRGGVHGWKKYVLEFLMIFLAATLAVLIYAHFLREEEEGSRVRED